MSEPREKRLRFLRELYEANPNNLSMREREELDALSEILSLTGKIEGVAAGLVILAEASWDLDVAAEQRRIAEILRDAVKTAEVVL